ncbi:hypothetical protein [Serratia marcescens]|uniref:hypothetical protein n=1 Tax=Serratia TaxID=613 RepID=UPI00237FC0B7|nr:hypothetical protein [Serratia marcescens]
MNFSTRMAVPIASVELTKNRMPIARVITILDCVIKKTAISDSASHGTCSA